MSILKVPLTSRYKEVADSTTQQDAIQTLEQVRSLCEGVTDSTSAHKEAIDAAFHEVFYELIASLDIETDDYTPIWSLLDSINLLCDHELCEPALGFWLVEDLLDSLTISGCRKVFDYLEMRRERMTKQHLKQKNLTILRCCNDLLRRLSRAEDTVFCGRVFIYLFQSFPLGDKSSVNLRGEFHVENITTFDELPSKTENGDGSMEVDHDAGAKDQDTNDKAKKESNGTQETAKLDELYPIFWSLQALFSQPTKLFEQASMELFKNGITQTMSYFSEISNRSTAGAAVQDIEKRGVKRKRNDDDEEQGAHNSTAFNPRYLTNRDLFDLEVHDIEFRRHMLVQALILLDFLLSLTPQNKAKLTSTIDAISKRLTEDSKNKQQNARNNSMMKAIYERFTLSEDDRNWVVETRRQIEKYLEEGNGTEGRYYLRMVNMVLSRDKNWAIWKAASCQEIKKEPVDAGTDQQSQEALQEVSEKANRPMARPEEIEQLTFLLHTQPVEAMKERKPQVPTLDEYYRSIELDNLDLDFATEAEVKEIEAKKAGKLWRALRSARGKRFALCEEIKNGENLGALIGREKDEVTKSEDEQQIEDRMEKEEETALESVIEESGSSTVPVEV